MKKLLTIIIAAISINGFVSGQTPQAFKYQAVARDLSGNVLTDRNVSFRISILQESASGTAVYSEKHNRTTNAFGLIDLEIGNGTTPTGSFASINWASNLYFLKVEMDPNGGSSYQLMGTSQLLSVPYALQSKKAEEVADNSVTASKIAGNAVTIAKLPTGATATSYLRGDGTWQIPPVSSPAGNDGSIQYNYRGIFSYSQYLHWDYSNYRLGIGTSSPDSKVQIVSNSTQTYPHLKLYESEADYARLTFQNSSGVNYWSVTALNSTTNSLERFNIFNSVSGDVLSIAGTGNVGINHTPDVIRKLYVDGETNGAGYFANNSASYNTLKAVNQGASAAAYFENNGSSYTLFAKNYGTGPAAYFDGTLQISGGNTSEVNRSQTGSANLVPICYGTVSSTGTILSGSGNFSVSYDAVNKNYEITINGETYNYSDYTTLVTHIGSGTIGFPSVTSGGGILNITFYMIDGAKKASWFSFLVYKP